MKRAKPIARRVAAAAQVRSVLRVLVRDLPVDRRSVLGFQDGGAERGRLEKAGNPGERLEVDARRVLGGEEHEEEIGRLAVDGLEVDPRAGAAEGGEQPGEPR